MANPYLPLWEYIPDGEPRVFGDRVYIYGSHDRPGSDSFCDFKLKVWSASVNDLNNWVCHGHIFHTRDDRDHKSDTADWTDGYLYAPDVVEKDGKYYLFCYIMWAKGCVAVADKPEGPFKLVNVYEYDVPEELVGQGTFIDPGVLVDDDGRNYVYCGFEKSFMCEMENNMYKMVSGSYIPDIIPVKDDPSGFFEACSPRKVGDTYYLIYSPKIGSRLDYMTSKSPTGPFVHRGTIIDNSIDYPGGNDHGSICCINGQWYIFYHKMTNGTIMSRRACVEKIEMLPDGSIPQVEMTSLGFEDSLNPYKITPADIACVLKGGTFITEYNMFTRVVTGIKNKSVIGYKYYDFGEDYSTKTMELAFKVKGCGCCSVVSVYIDGEDGKKIGECKIGADDGVYKCIVDNVTGRHSLYFVVDHAYSGAFENMFDGRNLFELESFVFMK